MNPFDLFTHLDPGMMTGASGADRLLDAARHFPGGPGMLVFALFWAPVGPGVPAGVLLARHVPLHPGVTFALYALSDVLSSFICHPLFRILRRHGGRLRALRWLGQRMMKLAMWGAPLPRAEDLRAGTRGAMAPALLRVATVGFGVDVYTAGMLVSGLGVPALAGWAAAIAGDLAWFALLLLTSTAAAAVVDDDRVVAVVVLVAMILLPRLARPFLRRQAAATARN